MSAGGGVVGPYIYMLINRLFYSETFASQVRAVQQLAALLAALGDGEAEKVFEAAVRFEAEAEVLDELLREAREEVARGVAEAFPPELAARVAKLRRALERFKAELIVRLEDRMGGKLPVVREG